MDPSDHTSLHLPLPPSPSPSTPVEPGKKNETRRTGLLFSTRVWTSPGNPVSLQSLLSAHWTEGRDALRRDPGTLRSQWGRSTLQCRGRTCPSCRVYRKELGRDEGLRRDPRTGTSVVEVEGLGRGCRDPVCGRTPPQRYESRKGRTSLSAPDGCTSVAVGVGTVPGALCGGDVSRTLGSPVGPVKVFRHPGPYEGRVPQTTVRTRIGTTGVPPGAPSPRGLPGRPV